MNTIVDTWVERRGIVKVPPRNSFEMGKFLNIQMIEVDG